MSVFSILPPSTRTLIRPFQLAYIFTVRFKRLEDTGSMPRALNLNLAVELHRQTTRAKTGRRPGHGTFERCRPSDSRPIELEGAFLWGAFVWFIAVSPFDPNNEPIELAEFQSYIKLLEALGSQFNSRSPPTKDSLRRWVACTATKLESLSILHDGGSVTGVILILEQASLQSSGNYHSIVGAKRLHILEPNIYSYSFGLSGAPD
ncbi:hypothetical protein B0H13DRAFT_2488807 [Mycena leptocephala]|nr:hypothetical protein B0H13DRAFT_2488807 [Mycena leptocephala]